MLRTNEETVKSLFINSSQVLHNVFTQSKYEGVFTMSSSNLNMGIFPARSRHTATPTQGVFIRAS